MELQPWTGVFNYNFIYFVWLYLLRLYKTHVLFPACGWRTSRGDAQQHPSRLFKKTPFKDPELVLRSVEQVIGVNRTQPSDAVSSWMRISLRCLSARQSRAQSNPGIPQKKVTTARRIKRCGLLEPCTKVRQLCWTCAFPWVQQQTRQESIKK